MSVDLKQDIPDGYKQTEVGVIPEDWSAVQAKEVVEFFGGYGFSSRLASNSGTKWLKIANVGINEIKWDAISYLPEHLIQPFKDYSLKENDVVMALTRPLLGDRLKVAKLASNDLPALLNQRVAKLRPKNSNNLNFIYFSIQREDFIAAMNLSMAGTDPPNIGTNALGNIFIAIPKDDKEQTAIANALSDMDALLSELEKLIAKKQAMKTATMQQLLTGKTRLTQFAFYSDINSIEGAVEGKRKGTKPSELGEIPDDWEVKKFGQVMRIRHGKDQKSIQVSGGLYPIFGTGGQMGSTNTPLYDKPSVLIGRKGTINKPRFTDYPFWTVDTLFYSEVANTESVKFIYYKFCMIDWMQYNEASGVPSLNASTIENVLASFPDIKEQNAIVTILSDIDNEIQAFEQRLSKTRQIKQGMMQELLTGKTRLPFGKDITSEASV